MTVESLDTLMIDVAGSLPQILSQLDPNTIQHSFEITNAKRTDGLRRKPFLPADFPLYDIVNEDGDQDFVNGEATVFLAMREHNLFFKNIGEAIQQSGLRPFIYRPRREEAETVKRADSTLKLKLSDLDLKLRLDSEGLSYGDGDKYSDFKIDTADYDTTLNPVQRAAAERIFGQGEDFVKNMNMFNEEGGKVLYFELHGPSYVKRTVIEGGSAIARIPTLDVDWNFGFNALHSSVCSPPVHIRGVPLRSEAEIYAEYKRHLPFILHYGIPSVATAEALQKKIDYFYSHQKQ